MVTLVADVTVDGTAEQAVALAVATFGRLDIRLYNAGRILYKNSVDLSREEWDADADQRHRRLPAFA